MSGDKKYNILIEDLKRKILSGELAAGTKLPGQLALAKLYGVSPITSERALAELEKAGLVERRSRSGSFVKASPRLFSRLLILTKIWASENFGFTDYYAGIAERAEAAGVALEITRVSAPDFESKMEALDNTAVIFFGFEDRELIKSFKSRNIPHLVMAVDAQYADFCVTENRKAAARELANCLINKEKCRRTAFVYNPFQTNHKACLDGYLASAEENGLKPLVYEADEGSVNGVVSDLMTGQRSPDAIIITGSMMPLAAMPLIFRSKPSVKLGVFTDNTSVLSLRQSVWTAFYSQSETGKLAFDILYGVAAGKIKGGCVQHPPYEIIRPISRQA